jgi:hypothetical protein
MYSLYYNIMIVYIVWRSVGKYTTNKRNAFENGRGV